MIKLTYKDKKLSYDDKEAIKALKREMIIEQDNCCYVCHRPFFISLLPQMAHRISKAGNNIKVFGYEVIHHRFNIRITCCDCNSSVMINRSKTVLVNKLVKKIMKDLNNKE